MNHPPDKPLPLTPLEIAQIRHRQIPLPQIPQRIDIWMRKALNQAPILQDADWFQTAAYRVTDGDEVLSVKAYIEGIFQGGFTENPAEVSVGFGMSTGGIASADDWDGARKYLCMEDQYLFLVAAEGFYLPSVDRQNRSYEIMSHQIAGRHILACARIDTIDSEYGQLFGLTTDAICFNHAFVRPVWLTNVSLIEKLSQFIEKVGGIEKLDADEYRAVCHYLGIAPPGL